MLFSMIQGTWDGCPEVITAKCLIPIGKTFEALSHNSALLFDPSHSKNHTLPHPEFSLLLVPLLLAQSPGLAPYSHHCLAQKCS